MVSAIVLLTRVRSNDDLARVVTENIRPVPGITSSGTLISFGVFSRLDLEGMFSIGMER